MNQDKIRNFCIIAHIDHGKSTLADRFLELTGTIPKREMREQFLDQMDLERERGITIKLAPVQMQYKGYELNLIDTPGHVDFSYEVSRSLACVEGAILLVDATQGIQAQTLANLYLALEQNLVVIPVINKIDLPNAETEKVRRDLVKLIGVSKEDVYQVSAKTGQGVLPLLEVVVKKIPSPAVKAENLQILIFDSKFDDYKGVVAFGRVFAGSVKAAEHIKMMATHKNSEVLEVGVFKPQLVKKEKLEAGEIGYLVTGLKNVDDCRVGDTITFLKTPASQPLPGYKLFKPMVFAGIYCQEGNDYPKLKEAISKLKLNDASLTFEPEHSQALGFGFRCGFLGLLHLEICQERLKREYNLNLIITVPSVAYKVILNEAGVRAWMRKEKAKQGQIIKELTITSPLDLPEPSQIEKIEEPWMKVDIISPSVYLGQIMRLVEEKKGEYKDTEYLDEARVILHFELPLSSILVDFYDKIKSVTSGYASLNYEFIDYRKCEVERLDILVAGEIEEALSSIVYQDSAYQVGRQIVKNLKEVLPRQLFEVKIQAAIGSKIIAAERIPPMRKDVTAKLYGGDVTRKRKLLEKQKKGKKRMKVFGKLDIPQEAFLAILKR